MTPTPAIYTGAGGAIYGGRFAPSSDWSGDVGVAGDSLTDTQYDSGGYRLGFPLTMFPPRVTFNAGWQAQTIEDLANRFQAVINAFPNIAVWVIRIGTNGPGSNTYQYQFERLFVMLKASGKKAIFHAIPPRATTTGVDSAFIAENAWVKARCESDSGSFQYIEDSQDMGDSHYVVLSGYTIDGTHMNGKGVRAQALRMAPRFLAILPHTDPRITDGADKYPSNGTSTQYVQNPLMAGTAGTKQGSVTGTVPSNWDISSYGGGTSCAVSIVAADVGDANQTPWMRYSSIVSGGASHALLAVPQLQHPAIAADGTIVRFDVIAEVRFNSIDATPFDGIGLFPNVAGAAAGPGGRINMNGLSTTINDQMVFRTSLPRTQQDNSGNSRPLAAYAANSLGLTIGVNFNAAQATIAGSIDIRCVSFRGQTT